jgi:acetyl esterase/lipase
MKRWVAVIWISTLSVAAQAQQLSPETRWAAETAASYHIQSNIVYKTAANYECKLDVISARDTSHPRPTLVYIHGGGWILATKDGSALRLLPFLTKGMNVVNVDYRLASVSLAPAAVEDCRCALRWVYQNAKEYGFDLNHLIVNGHSAGGHLSLMTGMLTSDAGFDNECAGPENLRVSAIVNFYGITDAADLIEGPNQRTWAMMWFGSLRDRLELAQRLSPLTYVRPGLPPIFTVHGDADDVVPYDQAVRLQKALDAAGVPNELYTVKGAKHGAWSADENSKVYGAVFSFLKRYGILPD